MFGRKQSINSHNPVHFSESSDSKLNGCFASLGAYMLVIFGSLFLFHTSTSFISWFNANNNVQKEADIHLNSLIEEQAEFPVGEYVDLEVFLSLGSYAQYTQSREMSSYDISATVKEVDYYYVMLEDRTIMSVATANTKEKQALNRMTDGLIDVLLGNEDPENIEPLLLRGNLLEMSNPDLINFYYENLESVGYSPDDPMIRLLYLDTEAGREGGYTVPTIIIVFLVFIAVVLFQNVTKNLQSAARKRAEKTQDTLERLRSITQEGESVMQDHDSDISYHKTESRAGNAESRDILDEMNENDATV